MNFDSNVVIDVNFDVIHFGVPLSLYLISKLLDKNQINLQFVAYILKDEQLQQARICHVPKPPFPKGKPMGSHMVYQEPYGSLQFDEQIDKVP